MTATAGWPAPAKLNLFLHVTGRRADGYHELDTLFQLVDLCDRLHFEPREDGRIERPEGPADVPADADLVVRAAVRLREAAGRPWLGATIRLDKRIPLGGGLGGGSSDAATTLVALDRLWGLELGEDRLAALGLALGADVPVFVRGRTAFASGVGERLEAAEVAPAWFAVIHPGVAVATGGVFQALGFAPGGAGRTRGGTTGAGLTEQEPVRTIRGSFSPGWPGRGLPGRNDLEPVVVAREPAVRAALDWLGRRGAARLTGSGACVFAPFEARATAESALAGLPDGWSGWAVAGLAESPLRARLADARPWQAAGV